MVWPAASFNMTRTPLAGGSMGGEVGTVMMPLSLRRSSPGGVPRLTILILSLLAKTGTMLVHGSHASPIPSWSLSACDGFASFGQLSSMSHTPSPSASASRTSAGQVALAPVQCSAGSHGPVDARQTEVAGSRASAGHVTEEPSQASSASQMPAAARHTTPAGWNASAGQSGPVPVQVSATSHGPANARHSTEAGLRASAGQGALVPVHVSATSQSPAAGRHSVPALEASGGWMKRPLPSHASEVQTLASLAHGVELAAGAPPHLPAWQLSDEVQSLPSSQAVPSATGV